jgi:hypothetical protein
MMGWGGRDEVAMTFRRLHAFGLGAIITGIVAGTVVLVAPARKIAPEPHLPVAERLPDAERSTLRTQMRAHTRAALPLLSTVTMLDWSGAATLTDELLTEPPVPRGAGDGRAQLPERFFELQDELRQQLQAINGAAKARDANALAEAFAAISRTCVRCHDAYLTGR